MATARGIAFEELVDPTFLAAVGRLALVARQVPRGGRFAEQRSRDLGHGMEFRDFRAYTPGDDLRSIDWNIYRRLGRVVLRLFEELEDLPLYLMPDVSASAYEGDPPRAAAGLKSALALAAIGLGQHDSAAIHPFAEDLLPPLRLQSGQGRILAFARFLAGLEPAGRTDVVRSLARFGAARRREGLLVLISDFFDPAGIDAIVAALGRVRHRLLLVQLVRKSDAEPTLRGDLRLVDCESASAVDVSITPAVLERYREAHRRFEETLTAFARRRGAGLLRIDVEEPVLPQIAALFHSGSYTA